MGQQKRRGRRINDPAPPSHGGRTNIRSASALQGWCTTCAARVLEGEFDPAEALRYYPQDKEAGFILLCTAQPRSPMRIQTYQRDAMRAHATTTTSPPPERHVDGIGERRHMPFRPDRPYNALAPLPPPVDPCHSEGLYRGTRGARRDQCRWRADPQSDGPDQQHSAAGGASQLRDRDHRDHDRPVVPVCQSRRGQGRSGDQGGVALSHGAVRRLHAPRPPAPVDGHRRADLPHAPAISSRSLDRIAEANAE